MHIHSGSETLPPTVNPDHCSDSVQSELKPADDVQADDVQRRQLTSDPFFYQNQEAGLEVGTVTLSGQSANHNTRGSKPLSWETHGFFFPLCIYMVSPFFSLQFQSNHHKMHSHLIWFCPFSSLKPYLCVPAYVTFEAQICACTQKAHQNVWKTMQTSVCASASYFHNTFTIQSGWHVSEKYSNCTISFALPCFVAHHITPGLKALLLHQRVFWDRF